MEAPCGKTHLKASAQGRFFVCPERLPVASKAALELIASLRDEATRELQRISGELGHLAKEAERAQRTSQSAIGGIGRTANQVGGFIRSAASTATGFLAAEVGIRAVGSAFNFVRDSTVNLNTSLDDARATVMAFTKDAAVTEQVLAAIRAEADKTPWTFNQFTSSLGTLIPAARIANEPLMDLIKTAEILAASNPLEGLEGASYSLREAVTGDFTSIADRFNLSRVRLKQLKDEGVPALEAVRQAMQEVGLDMDLVANRAATLRGRWSTLTDTLAGPTLNLTGPLFGEIKQGIIDVQSFLDRNKNDINGWTTFIGQKVGQGARWVRVSLGGLVTSAFETGKGWVTAFLSMESQTARSLGRIVGFVVAFGRTMAQYGLGLMRAFAEGMMIGIRYVVIAINTLGRILGSLLEPHSPPAFLPKLDLWGQQAAQLYLDSWANADPRALGVLGDKIEAQIAEIQGKLGAISALRNNAPRDFVDLPSEERLKRIRELLESPDLSPQRRKDLALQAEELQLRGRLQKLEADKAAVQQRQLELARQQVVAANKLVEAVTAIASVAEKGLSDNERAIRSLQLQRAGLDSVLELRKIEKQLNEGTLTDFQRQSLELQRQALLLERNQRIAEATELGIDPSMLSALQNVPIGEADLGPIEDVMSANEKNLRWAQMQGEELADLVELRKLEAVMADESATAAQKAAAQFQHDAIEAQRALRLEEATELGFDVGALAALQNIPIVLSDIGLGADAASGKLKGAAGAAGDLADALAGVGAGGGLGDLGIGDDLSIPTLEELLPDDWETEWDRLWGEFSTGFDEGGLAFENFKSGMKEWKLPELKFEWPWETKDGKNPLDGLTALFDGFEWPDLPDITWPWEDQSKDGRGFERSVRAAAREAAKSMATEMGNWFRTNGGPAMVALAVGLYRGASATEDRWDAVGERVWRSVGAALARKAVDVDWLNAWIAMSGSFMAAVSQGDWGTVAVIILGALGTALDNQLLESNPIVNMLEGAIQELTGQEVDLSFAGWAEQIRTLMEGDFDVAFADTRLGQIIDTTLNNALGNNGKGWQVSLGLSGINWAELLVPEQLEGLWNERIAPIFATLGLDVSINIPGKLTTLKEAWGGAWEEMDGKLATHQTSINSKLAEIDKPLVAMPGKVVSLKDVWTGSWKEMDEKLIENHKSITKNLEDINTPIIDLPGLLTEMDTSWTTVWNGMGTTLQTVWSVTISSILNTFLTRIAEVQQALDNLSNTPTPGSGGGGGSSGFGEGDGPSNDDPNTGGNGTFGFRANPFAYVPSNRMLAQAEEAAYQAVRSSYTPVRSYSSPTSDYAGQRAYRNDRENEGATYITEGDVHVHVHVNKIDSDRDEYKLAYRLGNIVNRKKQRTRR